MEVTLSTPKSPKQVKVHADGCSPATLELFKGKDSVQFVQSDLAAPTSVFVNNAALFGTTTCTVGKSSADAPVYPALAPGNYGLGLSAAAAGQAGAKGTVQVLCLAVTGAMGTGDSGSIKVNR